MVDPIFGPDSVVSQNNTTGVGRPTPGHHKRSNPAGIFIFTMNGNVGRVALSVYRLATGWTVRGSNPGEDEIFRTCPDRPWGPPSLLYHAYRVFPGGKERPGRDADPSPPSSAVGHERVELYLYSPLWAVRPVQSLSACTRVTFT